MVAVNVVLQIGAKAHIVVVYEDGKHTNRIVERHAICVLYQLVVCE